MDPRNISGVFLMATPNEAFITQVGGETFSATITQTGGDANYSWIRQAAN